MTRFLFWDIMTEIVTYRTRGQEHSSNAECDRFLRIRSNSFVISHTTSGVYKPCLYDTAKGPYGILSRRCQDPTAQLGKQKEKQQRSVPWQGFMGFARATGWAAFGEKNRVKNTSGFIHCFDTCQPPPPEDTGPF